MDKFPLSIFCALFLALIISLPTSAESRKSKIDEHINGGAEILHIEQNLKFWVLPDEKIYGAMAQHTRSTNTKSSWKALLIEAESIDLGGYLAVIDESIKPLVVRAREEVTAAAKGAKSKLHCYARNDKDGTLICRLLINNINLSEALLMEGFSKFDPPPGIDRKTSDELKKAENIARNHQRGVWTPLYGMFREPKNN
jgi:hypothetical protein